MKNLLLADDYSVVDDRICPPPTVQPEDLGHLLDTVAERLESGGVLMLSGAWSAHVTPVQKAGGEQRNPAMAAAGDWFARVVQGDTWIMWSRARHKIWTCEVDALPVRGKDTPLAHENPMVTALRHATWTTLTGVPWVGTPGMTGNGLLVDGWKELSPKTPPPRFHAAGIWAPVPKTSAATGGSEWPYGHIEQAYTPRQWSREHTGPLHGYDLNMAYLAAYKVAELPADALEHHVTPTDHAGYFDRRLGGLWRVELSPWPYAHLLPDPAGYAPALPDGSRWLTTPTLVLLDELERRGDYGGFHVRERWTAPARRLTRKWGDLIGDIAGAAADPIAYAAKQVYKQTYGMWARPTRVYRPDWHYTIIAQSRVNLWRKMDRAYRNMLETIGGHDEQAGPAHIPVRVETDAVFYSATATGRADGTPWAWEHAPHGFKLDPAGIKSGHFKPVPAS